MRSISGRKRNVDEELRRKLICRDCVLWTFLRNTRGRTGVSEGLGHAGQERLHDRLVDISRAIQGNQVGGRLPQLS